MPYDFMRTLQTFLDPPDNPCGKRILADHLKMVIFCVRLRTRDLPPPRFNMLLRRYPDGNQTELEHLRQIIMEGIVKSPALASEAVLVTAVKEFAAIVVGQDLTTALAGQHGREYEFTAFETVALRLSEPSSACVLQ